MSAFVYVCVCVYLYMCAQGQCVNLLNIYNKASQTFTIKAFGILRENCFERNFFFL